MTDEKSQVWLRSWRALLLFKLSVKSNLMQRRQCCKYQRILQLLEAPLLSWRLEMFCPFGIYCMDLCCPVEMTQEFVLLSTSDSIYLKLLLDIKITNKIQPASQELDNQVLEVRGQTHLTTKTQMPLVTNQVQESLLPTQISTNVEFHQTSLWNISFKKWIDMLEH